ncbi:hypothetical protein [Paenibacillus brevis]|uniref:Uncharacterized protein n=1 Tax=Paenibacillus brevis TaxID=2841508 RepID=A0ABS6FJH0_9BACL|nr:hypothetical protein [Paenibacillus brevis]MBU5670304.1 hypothetical protein [Paenibacillus brevis]
MPWQTRVAARSDRSGGSALLRLLYWQNLSNQEDLLREMKIREEDEE